MDNFFKKMNRQEKREFDKLPKEKQVELIGEEISRELFQDFSKNISKSFYQGHLNACKMFYDKYVKEYEKIAEAENSEEKLEKCATIVGSCFAEIKKLAEKFDEEFPIVEEEKGENK